MGVYDKNTPGGYFILLCIRKKLPVAGSGGEKAGENQNPVNRGRKNKVELKGG
jgi:hypothetical protein